MTEYETKSLAVLERIASLLESKPTTRAASGAQPTAGDAVLLPNYGRSKGQPVVGASLQDLEFYANGCRRSLGDPAKARWHDKERQLLAVIEAEIARQGGTLVPPPTDADAPPPPSDDAPPF